MARASVIGVGVIGLRFAAQVHVPAFRRHGTRVEVRALAGRDAGAAAQIAADADIPRAYGDWRALLDDDAVDAITIAVPPAAQGSIVRAVAERGKHVFCEKPLCPDVATAERMLEAVTRAGVVHAVDFMFPEIDAWQHARALLGEGVIGRPLHFSYTWRVETYASRTNADSWKNRVADGGGALGNFASHVLFNIEWLLGPIARLEALRRTGAAPESAFVDAVAELTDGTHGAIAVSTAAFLGEGHRISIFGDSGTLVLSNATADYACFQVYVGTRGSGELRVVHQDVRSGGEDGRIAPVSRIVDRFVSGIEGAAVPAPNLADGVRVQRWLQVLARGDAH